MEDVETTRGSPQKDWSENSNLYEERSRNNDNSERASERECQGGRDRNFGAGIGPRTGGNQPMGGGMACTGNPNAITVDAILIAFDDTQTRLSDCCGCGAMVCVACVQWHMLVQIETYYLPDFTKCGHCWQSLRRLPSSPCLLLHKRPEIA